MKEMISMCGLLCHECGAFQATQADDNAKRSEVAKLWSKEYKATIRPEDINCDGCISEGPRLFNYCTICEIRKCGKEKNVVNCAHCGDYACTRLEEFFLMVPDAKKRLDAIREEIQR